jgi:hypothetical protein
VTRLHGARWNVVMASGESHLWDEPSYWSEPAEQAFAKAIGRGRRQDLLDRIRGRPLTLLSFDDVPNRAGLIPEPAERLASVPLAEIVGSVGKSADFTRCFRPRTQALRSRWKKTYALVHGLRGYEPIELYEVDGVFYVLDGHFRVSVARHLGHNEIQARIRRWS